MDKFNLIAINKMMVDINRPIWCAVSFHEEYAAPWKRQHKLPHFLVCPRYLPGVNRVVPNTTDQWAGTSSLYGVRIALEFGNAEKIVLAGVPMDDAGHYWEGKTPGVVEIDSHTKISRAAWLRIRGLYGDKIRSLSGWTREVFGAPTEEWLNGTH